MQIVTFLVKVFRFYSDLKVLDMLETDFLLLIEQTKFIKCVYRSAEMIQMFLNI